MRLESLHIKNYGCLADFELREIPPLAIFVGANGTGKSTLFDVFQFLRDCLRDDVGVALGRRGGFEAVRTTGGRGPIEIELSAHETAETSDRGVAADVSYRISVEPTAGIDGVALEALQLKATFDSGAVNLTISRDVTQAVGASPDTGTDLVFAEELLRPDRLFLDQPAGLIFSALHSGRSDMLIQNDESSDEPRSLPDLRPEAFEMIYLIEKLRTMLRGSYISNIDPAAAKVASEVARDHRLSERGENLANALHHQSRAPNADSLNTALSAARRAIPDFVTVEPVETFDGRVALRFVDASNGGGFNAQQVSDGTVKLVAYLLLLNEPDRHPLLCIEEPENYLYPTLMWDLIDEIRGYAQRGDAQVFVATHSPDLVDAADPGEVFWLSKMGGKPVVHRVNDDPQLVAQHEFGDHLGRMWQSGAFEGAHPE